MTRRRYGSWVLGVAVLLCFSASASAIGPAAILVHGGELEKPILIRPGIGSFVFMWGGGTPHYDTQAKAARPTGLEGRRYLSYDVFWGWYEDDELKPEVASQHGRLYLPTVDQPAAVVLTPPHMKAESTAIPTDLEGFIFGRPLTGKETAQLAAARVPGFGRRQ